MQALETKIFQIHLCIIIKYLYIKHCYQFNLNRLADRLGNDGHCEPLPYANCFFLSRTLGISICEKNSQVYYVQAL